MKTNGEGYEYVEDDDGNTMYLHRLLAMAEYGVDAVADMEVHHKVPVQWLNVPDNVEPLDPDVHSQMHLNR
jgi:hypothetical protein